MKMEMLALHGGAGLPLLISVVIVIFVITLVNSKKD